MLTGFGDAIALLLTGVFIGIVAAARWRRRFARQEADAWRPAPVPRTRRKPVKKHDLDWILTRDDWVVLDVEATGYTDRSEIIEVGILDASGSVLMEQRVLPKGRIPRAATEIHGITRDMLKDCPRWPDIEAIVRRHLAGRRVISYNVAYEQRLLRQTAEKWGVPPIDILGHCAMLAYAEHRGVIGHAGYKWHKLVDACRHEGIALTGAHSAVADASNARALVLRMVCSKRVDAARQWASQSADLTGLLKAAAQR